MASEKQTVALVPQFVLLAWALLRWHAELACQGVSESMLLESQSLPRHVGSTMCIRIGNLVVFCWQQVCLMGAAPLV